MDNGAFSGPDRSQLATKRVRVRRVPALPRRAAETAGRTMPEWTDLGAYMAHLDELAAAERSPRVRGPRPTKLNPPIRELAAFYGIAPKDGDRWTAGQCADMRQRWEQDRRKP